MKINTEKLLTELKDSTHLIIVKVNEFKLLSEAELNWKENAEKWSILECLEHLNLYGDFYIPEINKAIQNSQTSKRSQFKSGVLGNYFAESMLPKEGMKKMKTFKDKNPANSTLTNSVIDRFLDQQASILKLLDAAQKVDLQKTKTAVSISKLIRLRLGDTFRFIINHNKRHFVQIEKIILQLKN